tara:strand:- start:1363 stop:1617 length:255 start_codon:yes stop_codon:yes gene_type:complete
MDSQNDSIKNKYRLGDKVNVLSRSKNLWKEGTVYFPINVLGKFVRDTENGVSVEYSDGSGYTMVKKEEFPNRLKLIKRFIFEKK